MNERQKIDLKENALKSRQSLQNSKCFDEVTKSINNSTGFGQLAKLSRLKYACLHHVLRPKAI